MTYCENKKKQNDPKEHTVAVFVTQLAVGDAALYIPQLPHKPLDCE